MLYSSQKHKDAILEDIAVSKLQYNIIPKSWNIAKYLEIYTYTYKENLKNSLNFLEDVTVTWIQIFLNCFIIKIIWRFAVTKKILKMHFTLLVDLSVVKAVSNSYLQIVLKYCKILKISWKFTVQFKTSFHCPLSVL